MELTRFEQELIRYLRALPFAAQQHVSRYIIRLQRENGALPQDLTAPRKLGEPAPPLWNMTGDELDKLRKEMDGQEEEDQ